MDRSEYAPINGSARAGGSSGLVSALLVVIAALSIAILVLAVMLYQTSQTLKKDIKNVQPPAPFTNLDFTKDDLTNYYTTQHWDVVAGLVEQWTAYMTSYVQGKDPVASKMAVVFDIDETSLNNYPYYAPSDVSSLGVDYGFVYESWNDWIYSAASKAIPSTHSFYLAMQALGLQTIFITGRRDTQQAITETNLASQNFANYTTLITRSPQFYNSTAEQYKSYWRQQLTNQGYNIIGCIGDQISDCNNGYAGYIMKIPNYIYYIE